MIHTVFIDIRNFIEIQPKPVGTEKDVYSRTVVTWTNKEESSQTLYHFPGVGRRLGSCSTSNAPPLPRPHDSKTIPCASSVSIKDQNSFNLGDFVPNGSTKCPVCFTVLPASQIDAHLDICVGKGKSTPIL